MTRFRITSLIILVAIIAAGLGTMRAASEIAEGAANTILILTLLIGLIGALVSRNGAWIGFAVASCGYFLFDSYVGTRAELLSLGVRFVAERLHPSELPRPPLPKVNQSYLDSNVVDHRQVLALDYEKPIPGLDDSERLTMRDYKRTLIELNVVEAMAVDRAVRARSIGSRFLVIALGWIGATAGRLIEDQRRRATTISSITP